MNDLQVLPVQSGLFYTERFTDILPTSVTVTACAWTISPSITLGSQADNFASNESTIKVSGAVHGVIYRLQSVATLSNGETFKKVVSLIGFDG